MVRSDTTNSIFRFFSFLIFNFYDYTVCMRAHQVQKAILEYNG